MTDFNLKQSWAVFQQKVTCWAFESTGKVKKTWTGLAWFQPRYKVINSIIVF